MKQARKKTLDKAMEVAISHAATAGIPLVFDRYEDMVPACGFGRMGLDCKACTQGPCRINPFDASNGTACGRDREGTVAASFLRLIADGAVANASFAGAEAQIAPLLFEGISLANEGNAAASQLLLKAIEVAKAGFETLPAARTGGSAARETEVGLGVLKPDKINLLLLGSIPAAKARQIAADLGSNPRVNLVGGVGGEAAGVAVAGNYNSQEALLATTGVDGVVAGKSCVSPGFLSLAAKQGVPVVDADRFEAAALLDAADGHFRMNNGRNLATRLEPAAATVGFGVDGFALSPGAWEGLSAQSVKGIALIGGCNNAATTQDGAVVRQALEFLKNDVLVIASGCAAVGLARAGYMDPARVDSLAGKGLRGFISLLSELVGVQMPAVLEAGSCWEAAAALKLARLFQQRLAVPLVAAMPEISRPAAWSSALAIAAAGLRTYVGPILPLDGGLETVKTLNEILRANSGALVGPGQVGVDPEAIVKLVMSNG